MEKSLLYIQVDENDLNSLFITGIQQYCSENPTDQIYLLNSPLGDKRYSYAYQKQVIVLASPKHKLIFIDLGNNESAFDEFYDDFIEDLNSISDKFNYKNHIGRPRDWKRNNTVQLYNSTFDSVSQMLTEHRIDDPKKQRVSELLVSLLIGSINDIEKVGAEVPETLLEKVKKNIILFDGEQTRFIYKEFSKKSISIQGLSGTGKTELLLHKLKELYILDNSSRIFFTCHNIALANNLRERVPAFFNFMKVEKQIEWNSRLWVSHAWGSRNMMNSGFYSFLCGFYGIPFSRFGPGVNYKTIFTQALAYVESLNPDEFKHAVDYILIDERQDFPEVFFKLCEKVAKNKVFIAGDIFQDIFENIKSKELEVDIVLNRCYRTDPRTLMFAHAIGLGLFENKKLNWFPDTYWNAMGYQIERHDSRVIHFRRDPIRRFENLNVDSFESVKIGPSNNVKTVVNIIKQLKDEHDTLKPEDIAIILLEENRKIIYDYIDTLVLRIEKELNWKVNRAYENKNKIPNSIYLSNPNNVKGLEFPFVICISAAVQDTYKYRNILYTMLTRSFIQSYLLINNETGLGENKHGLEVINKYNYIKTVEPTVKEKQEIEKSLTKFIQNASVSYEEFIYGIFDELEINNKARKKLIDALMQTEFDRFDRTKTIKFIDANIEFYR